MRYAEAGRKRIKQTYTTHLFYRYRPYCTPCSKDRHVCKSITCWEDSSKKQEQELTTHTRASRERVTSDLAPAHEAEFLEVEAAIAIAIRVLDDVVAVIDGEVVPQHLTQGNLELVGVERTAAVRIKLCVAEKMRVERVEGGENGGCGGEEYGCWQCSHG